MTEPAKVSPGKRAIDYAEETLKVHHVYAEAKAARDALDHTLTELSEWRDAKHGLESQMSDREIDLVAEERGKHSDMSQAAMDRHLKLVFNRDSYLIEKRAKLAQVISNIDGLEMDRIMAEKDITITVARMNELGGYFQYLATVKLDEIERKRNASAVAGVPGW